MGGHQASKFVIIYTGFVQSWKMLENHGICKKYSSTGKPWNLNTLPWSPVKLVTLDFKKKITKFC